MNRDLAQLVARTNPSAFMTKCVFFDGICVETLTSWKKIIEGAKYSLSDGVINVEIFWSIICFYAITDIDSPVLIRIASSDHFDHREYYF